MRVRRTRCPSLASTLRLAPLAVACIAGPTMLWAGNPAPVNQEAIDQGREIFERNWTYDAQAVPDANRFFASQADADREHFQGDLPTAFVGSLPGVRGDGLGPMHNATSCQDCHQAGGGAGVDRNVTLLTIDPRSDFLEQFRSRGQAGVGPDGKPIAIDAKWHQTTADQLRRLYPALIASSGQLLLDVVIHERSSRPFYDLIRKDLAEQIVRTSRPIWFGNPNTTPELIGDSPVLAGRVGGIDFYLSQRNSPPLHGLGLIDQVTFNTLNNVARSQSRRTNGKISGQVGLGKFGWRAQTSSLQQFVQGACAGELGLQLERTPQPIDAADPTYTSIGIDLDRTQVHQLTSYVRALPPPVRQTETVQTRLGKRLFAKIGCNQCHVENLPPARGLYSDLLLHDMGDLLQAPSPAATSPRTRQQASSIRVSLPRFAASSTPSLPRGLPAIASSISGYYGSGGSPRAYPMARPDVPKFPRGKLPGEVAQQSPLLWDVLQREWRTPPLWGLADSAPYLHDGRAATIDAAIRWHGGEASDSVAEYRSLEEDQRAAVEAFLGSLRAPEPAKPAVDADRDAQLLAAALAALDD